jgi:hypothetical protein
MTDAGSEFRNGAQGATGWWDKVLHDPTPLHANGVTHFSPGSAALRGATPGLAACGRQRVESRKWKIERRGEELRKIATVRNRRCSSPQQPGRRLDTARARCNDRRPCPRALRSRAIFTAARARPFLVATHPPFGELAPPTPLTDFASSSNQRLTRSSKNGNEHRVSCWAIEC